ncbi:MAG: hypothetical protein ACXAC8_04490 [Candidatus Hodarchaeales archaeon]
MSRFAPGGPGNDQIRSAIKFYSEGFIIRKMVGHYSHTLGIGIAKWVSQIFLNGV